jgi:quercetin dioxygenase-like cupin family protein
MKRMIIMLTIAVVVSITVGMIGNQGVLAQQRSVLSKTDLAGIEGREAVVLTVEGAPGLVGEKHYHPGDEFIYVLAGALIIEVEGKEPVTLKAGEAFHIPAKAVHRGKNTSPRAPFKVLTFGAFEKGQPDTTPAQ